MKMDAAWAARDYETLKEMITDGGRYNFEDGTSVSTPQICRQNRGLSLQKHSHSEWVFEFYYRK